jgi:DNA polymerase
VDSSQIEARLVAFLAGETSLLEQFERGEDVYANFGSVLYGRPINKKDDPEIRFISKTAILGLGFGMGWRKYQGQVKIQSQNQLGKAIELADTAAIDTVSTYRRRYLKIAATWDVLDNNAINILANGADDDLMVLGPVVIKKGVIRMPGRLKMYYHNLHYEPKTNTQRGGWMFTFGGKVKYLYGGKLLENIVQYLDRILVFDAALRIQQRIHPYRLAQQAHDENCYVVKEEHVDTVKSILVEEMTRRPSWGEALPLMAETGVGDSYGEAK